KVFEASAQIGPRLIVPGHNRSPGDSGIESERDQFVSQRRIDERLARHRNRVAIDANATGEVGPERAAPPVKKEVEIRKARHEIAPKSRSVYGDTIGSRLSAQPGVGSERQQE